MMISIIVTCYNIQNYIGQCLESLTKQTLKDIELIVVDDGSTDRTKEIIDEFSKKDKRIKTIFFEKNTVGGVGSAANAGIEASSGEYIAFADGDDWYEEDMYQTLYTTAKTTEADVVICNYTQFDQNTNSYINPSDFHMWKKSWTSNRAFKGLYIKKDLLKMNPVPWRKLYKRSLLNDNNIRFPVGDFFYEDNPFHWKCVLNANRFAFVNKILCYHRVNRQGQTMFLTNKSLLTMYRHHDTIYDFVIGLKLYNTYIDELLFWLIANTDWISSSIAEKYYDLLFDAVRKSFLKYDRGEAVSVIEKLDIWHRGKTLAKSAIYNNKKQFVKAIKFCFFENRWDKAMQAYKEKGVLGLMKLNLEFINYRTRLYAKNILLFPAKCKNAKYEKIEEDLQALANDIDEIKRQVSLLQTSFLFLLPESESRGQEKQNKSNGKNN